jgi:hypothetical protein
MSVGWHGWRSFPLGRKASYNIFYPRELVFLVHSDDSPPLELQEYLSKISITLELHWVCRGITHITGRNLCPPELSYTQPVSSNS